MVEKKQKELLIIIPAYNEEKNIERVLEELERPEIAEIADILVMNDAVSYLLLVMCIMPFHVNSVP